MLPKPNSTNTPSTVEKLAPKPIKSNYSGRGTRARLDTAAKKSGF